MSIEIELPAGYAARVDGGQLFIRKDGAEIARSFPPQKLVLAVESNKIKIAPKFKGARTHALAGTFEAHARAMIRGLSEPWVYKLKVCSIHFPMNLKLQGSELIINNFLGGKRPRVVKIPAGVEASVAGEIITLKSSDKEQAGLAAERIELATRPTGKDRRVFMDGIYMIEKAGKVVK